MILFGLPNVRLTVFIVFLVTFTLYGIEGIAEEIGHKSLFIYFKPFLPISPLLCPAVTNFQRIPSEKMQMVSSLRYTALTLDIDMDPLIQDLKRDLRFVLEKIHPHEPLISVD